MKSWRAARINNMSLTLGLEANAEKTKYMLMSCHQNARQRHNMKIADRSFENVAQSRYLGTTVTNKNLNQEEVKRRFISGNGCYHSVQNFLSSLLLSKSVKIRTYKSIILHVVLYGYETWSPVIRKEHRLRVFENRVLRRILGPERNEVIAGRKVHNEELDNLYPSPSIIKMMKSRSMRWAGHVARMGRRGMLIGFWWESQKLRDH
jgi:hypothetical protein